MYDYGKRDVSKLPPPYWYAFIGIRVSRTPWVDSCEKKSAKIFSGFFFITTCITKLIKMTDYYH